MTKNEFEERTRRLIAQEDYYLVENLYMAAGEMDKDEFCREMKAMCAWDGATDRIELRKCLKEIGRTVGAREADLALFRKRIREVKEELAGFLLGKACAYGDQDFYRKAVKLVGERGVVRLKLKLNLPLSDEDKVVINRMVYQTAGIGQFAPGD